MHSRISNTCSVNDRLHELDLMPKKSRRNREQIFKRSVLTYSQIVEEACCDIDYLLDYLKINYITYIIDKAVGDSVKW